MQGWRSEPMCKLQLFIQNDAMRETADELARVGKLQFIDLNADKSAFQRRFVNDIKLFDEMERKVRYFADQILKAEVELPVDARKFEDEDKLNVRDLNHEFDELEGELREMSKKIEQLERNHNELLEMQQVLGKDTVFFAHQAAAQSVHRADDEVDVESVQPVFGEAAQSAVAAAGPSSGAAAGMTGLGFLAGVIMHDKFQAFERVLFRAVRGNMYLKKAPLQQKVVDPSTGKDVEKDAFIVFFSGERSKIKIKKICDSFHANVYPCPSTSAERRRLAEQLDARVLDLSRALRESKRYREERLEKVALEIEAWARRLKKEKALYHTLNMFNHDLTRRALMAEAWCPVRDQDAVYRALRLGSERAGALVPPVMRVVATKDTPPTYFITNKFTQVYQDMVDSYGIPRYQEINPAVLSVVTFPFLFGVMFGDVIHGLLMFVFALLMILNEKKLTGKKGNEMVSMAVGGRYVILLMGLFSIYCGLLYNEFLSRPANLFGSAWSYPCSNCTEAIKNPNYTYPFGVDPVWKDTSNEIPFYNSMKMKMSVTFGVIQMVTGLFLKFLNAVHFKEYKDVFFEFIPEVVFMLGLFGYLVVAIFIKWYTDWNVVSSAPPSLITMLIGMFLSFGSVSEPIYGFGGTTQATVQSVLVVVSVLMVPLLLIPKPCLLKREARLRAERAGISGAASGGGQVHSSTSGDGGMVEVPSDASIAPLEDGHSVDSREPLQRGASSATKAGDAASSAHAAPHGDAHASGGGGGHGHGDGPFNFGEVMMHQIIHTIEYVLSCISNTASYLRLWALSLAHAQLANVFWTKMLFLMTGPPTDTGNMIVLGLVQFVTTFVFLGATIGIIMLMESLSAFLHTLRLHWVEFQSKFFAGDGKKFTPFSYEIVLRGDD